MAAAIEQKFETRPGQDVPSIPPDRAISLSVPFGTIKKTSVVLTSLKRPNRNHPINSDALEKEIAAWDAASDEAWDSIED